MTHLSGSFCYVTLAYSFTPGTTIFFFICKAERIVDKIKDKGVVMTKSQPWLMNLI